MRLTVCGAAVLVLLAAPAFSQERAARAEPAIVGTWKLNPGKSDLRVPADYLEIRQYSLRPDGFLVGLLLTGNTQTGYHYLQFVARSDGKDYPEYSDQIVGNLIAAGRPTPRMYAEMVIDEYVTEWTDKVDGRITGHGKKIVSSDRTTLTITVDGSPQLRIYDRQ